MSRRRQDRLNLSSKERVVLELLVSSGSMYGLQLVQQSKGALKRGTVYVTLGRMEQKGLIESRQEAVTSEADAISRRMYRPTAYGERVLQAWTTVARALAMEPGV
jgi:PadR family transcriptional regulator, regulatory protein PadR